VPRTATEVLLLHVPDTLESLWDKVVPPDGYTKSRSDETVLSHGMYRLAPSKREYTEPVWLCFDSAHGRGERPDSLWVLGLPNLAVGEVLSAMIQFPDWPLAWFDRSFAPFLSGYQLKHNETWTRVLCVERWDDDRQLRLNVEWADNSSPRSASPSIRKC
jgi:hypothetical protein